MNPETKSADALARELALQIGKEIRDAWHLGVPARIADVILKQTKLRELCAVAEALRDCGDFMAAICESTQNGGQIDNNSHMRRGERLVTTARKLDSRAKQALAALDGGGK